MLTLNTEKLEVFKMLSPDDCDAVLVSSQHGCGFIMAHRVVLQKRVLNLNVQNIHTHSHLIQRYRLSHNQVTGTVNFTHERAAYPEGRTRCGRTDALRALEAHLKSGWISYVTISSELTHFIGSNTDGALLTLCRQIVPISGKWCNGIAMLHTVPQEADALRTYLRLFRNCREVCLGTLHPLRSFEIFWSAYGSFALNAHTVSIRRSIGIDLELVINWLLSPSSFDRCLTLHEGSEEAYRLCVKLHSAFFKLSQPLAHTVTVIVWNHWTFWPISQQHKTHLFNLRTPLNDPVLSDHSSLEFHKPMSRKRRTYSPVYQRLPKRIRFTSSERIVTPEESAARGLLPDKKPRLCVSDHVRELGVHAVTSRKFRLTRYRSEFILFGMDKCSDPEFLLRLAFGNCIESALANARANGIRPTHFGVIIRSPNLNPQIEIPLARIEFNPLFSIHNLFMDVEQSKKEEEASLLGAPIEVDVTVAQGIAGAGRPKNFVKHNINRPSSLIEPAVLAGDTYCMFAAVELTRLYESREIDRKNEFPQLLKNAKRLRCKYILPLLWAAGIPTNLAEYSVDKDLQAVQDYYDLKYPGRYEILVFSAFGNYKPSWRGCKGRRQQALCIYHEQLPNTEGHFFGVRSIRAFLKRSQYCTYCEMPYKSKQTHRFQCKAKCTNCSEIGADYPCKPVPDYVHSCVDCDKTFLNPACFAKHVENRTCAQYRRCTLCGVIHARSVRHECGSTYCRVCHVYHRTGAGCFIAKLEPPKMTPYRLAIYDMETDQSHEINPKKFEHVPNFISCNTICTDCIAKDRWQRPLAKGECEICGDYRRRTWSIRGFRQTAVCRSDVSDDPLSGFVDWLLHDLDKRWTTIALAHNGGRFDAVLVLGELYRQGNLCPSMVRQGTKIFSMEVKNKNVCHTVFKDTFNFMPMALGKLVPTFRLGIPEKPFFPHMANRRSNFGVHMKNLPPKDDYLADAMMPEVRAEFDRFYEANYNTEFFLDEKLAEYCCSDTDILTHAVVAFRSTFLAITEDDPFRNSSTIASSCMRYWQMRYLKPNHVALTPERGYERCDRQSNTALKYLKWIARERGIAIQHRDSPEGEYRYGSLRLDGFVRRSWPQRCLAIEVYGCQFHGCPECLDRNTVCINGKTAAANYAATMERETLLHCEFDLETIWECGIRAKLKADARMRLFFERCHDTGPIENPREGFYGGRTGPLALYERAAPGRVIKYADYVSLYPSVNAETAYPVDHARVVVVPSDKTSVNWTHSSQNPYKGLLKVLVEPPRHTLIPVLPKRFPNDDRLLFALCPLCSELYRKARPPPDTVCRHSREERSFVVTLPHIEINEALDNGYIVRELFRVWEFDVFDSTLFVEYVRDFMRLKIQASGWPSNAKTDAERSAYLAEIELTEGIKINPADMCFNPGLRYIAKLCLNSLWGRFGLRNKLSKTLVTQSPAEYAKIVFCDRVVVNSVDMVNEDTVAIIYTPKDGFVKEGPSTNVMIALWTTSAARIKLFRSMKQIVSTPGCKLCYTDTDSLLYSTPVGVEPVPLGECMGQLKDEYPDKSIVEYICGGAKQYALKIVDKHGNVEMPIKLRGIRLNVRARESLTYDRLRERVLHSGGDVHKEPIILEYRRLRPDKRGSVYTMCESIRYDEHYQKGITRPDYTIVPFGWCE